MSHSSSGRSSLTSDKPDYGLAIVILDPAGRFGFHAAANLPDHHDAFGSRVIHQQFYRLFCRGTDDGVATNAYRRGDPKTRLGYLIGSFVCQCTRFGYDPDLSLFEHEPRHDPDLTFSGSDH